MKLKSIAAALSGVLLAAPALAQPNLDTVIINGDKLRRAEIDSNASIGIRTGRQIENAGNETIEDVVSQMANVSSAAGLALRGIPLTGATGGTGQTVTITIDGVPQGGFAQDIDYMSAWDMERVEVLRGPQSTNQGRNSLAGAVVIRSRLPSEQADFAARAALGSDGLRRIAVAGGGALRENAAALRISAEKHHSDGDIYNATRRDRNWGREDGHNVRARLRLTPWGDNYQALFSLSEAQFEKGDRQVEGVLRSPRQRIALANEISVSKNRSRNSALEQTFRALGADFTLLTTWANSRFERDGDYDMTELNQGTHGGVYTNRQRTQEVRANFDTALGPGKLNGVLGAYYSHERTGADKGYRVPLSYVLDMIGQCPSAAACEKLFGGDFIDRRNDEKGKVRSRAVFGEADYGLGALTLTAGLRYDAEDQARSVGTQTSGTTPMARQVFQQLIAAGAFGPDGVQQLASDAGVWLPKLGARYALSPQWVAGFTVQRGYRSGGVDYSYQRGANAYGPEYTRNYDFSLKGALPQRTFVSANLYRIDWSDQQVNMARNSIDNFIVNAGRSRLSGLELEGRRAMTRELEVFGALGFSHTEFLDFTSPQGDFSGHEFARSPRRTQSAGFNWTPGRLLANLHLAYEGQGFSNADNLSRNQSHLLLGGKLAYSFAGGIKAFASGSNLLDRDYIIYNNLNSVPGRHGVIMGHGRKLAFGLEGKI